MILECCYTLPERPGVYYFYDEKNTLLYIGKSKNIRKRVLSHFYHHDETKRHADLIKQTAHIDFTCTAGELGALLLESAEIKLRQPIYNRRLRKHQNLYSWVLNDELIPVLHRVDDIADDKISVGLYQSPVRAKQWLLKLAEKNVLCAKVLELESTHRGCCFNYQLFTVDINEAKKYSKALCKALASNDIETASKHLCEYISKKLYKIFEVDLREKLIKQVAKDLPQQSSMIFEALDNNEIELY